jgi:hypothetical protein
VVVGSPVVVGSAVVDGLVVGELVPAGSSASAAGAPRRLVATSTDAVTTAVAVLPAARRQGVLVDEFTSVRSLE